MYVCMYVCICTLLVLSVSSCASGSATTGSGLQFPKKAHKHKQIWGIMPRRGGWQNYHYVFSWVIPYGEKTHKQNLQTIARQSHENFVSVFFLRFSLPKILFQNYYCRIIVKELLGPVLGRTDYFMISFSSRRIMFRRILCHFCGKKCSRGKKPAPFERALCSSWYLCIAWPFLGLVIAHFNPLSVEAIERRGGGKKARDKLQVWKVHVYQVPR